MKEIDEMLDRWITNTIIKKQLRKLIIKEIYLNMTLMELL